jgi:hypothetical protein
MCQRLTGGEIGSIEFLAHCQLDKQLLKDVQTIMQLPNHVHRKLKIEDLVYAEPAKPAKKMPQRKDESKIIVDYWSRVASLLYPNADTNQGTVVFNCVKVRCDGDMNDLDDDAEFHFQFTDRDVAERFYSLVTGKSSAKAALDLGPAKWKLLTFEYIALFEAGVAPPKAVLRQTAT